jgi:hypothetical protein
MTDKKVKKESEVKTDELGNLEEQKETTEVKDEE